jgi:hypothetical protein
MYYDLSRGYKVEQKRVPFHRAFKVWKFKVWKLDNNRIPICDIYSEGKEICGAVGVYNRKI